MNIGVTTFGGDAGKSGIGQYIRQVLRGMFARAVSAENGQGARGAGEPGREEHRDEYHVYVHPQEESQYIPAGARARTHHVSPRLAAPLLNIGWHQWSLPRRCRQHQHDVLFLPAGNRRLPWSAPCPTVGVVHDLSSFHVARKYDAARLFYIKQVLPRFIRGLDRVIALSENGKRDLIEHAGARPEKITVVPSGVDHAVFYPQEVERQRARVAERFGLRKPYLVYVSRLEHPGKNHARLIQAFELFKARTGVPHELALVGGDWSGARAVRAAAKASRVADAIRFLGFAPAESLPDLYGAAAFSVFPSLYEGFGLPVLEAMACGTAVACANGSSLPEVAGDAAWLFDPRDVESIALALETLALDHARRQDLAGRGIEHARAFHWRRTAEQTLAVLREAARSC